MGVRLRQKDGKWYVFINHQGQRKAKCIGSDKRVAVQVQKQLEAKLALGDVGLLKEEPETVLFRDYAEQWLETYASRALKPSSKRVAHYISKTAISPIHVKNLVRMLSDICNHAIDDEVMQVNPASNLRKYLPATRVDPDTRLMPFTSVEIARYLRTMRERYPQYYTYFFTLARTGMHLGEALGLTWDDIQFGLGDADPHRFIEIRRTYDAVHNRMNAPKNGKTRRVDMSRDLRQCLLEWQVHCFDQAVLSGQTQPFPVVFATASGRPWAPVRVFHVHKRVCAQAGLRANRIHDLRHSYATIMLYEHHAPIQYVSEQLGHSSIKITVDTYGHPRQGMSTHLVDRLDTPAQLSATQTQLERRDVS